jgi:hypothetical protein
MSIVMGLTAWLVIVPLSLTTLTPALRKQYGVGPCASVLDALQALTAVTTTVLLLLRPICALADAAVTASFFELRPHRYPGISHFHAAAGHVVLLAAAVIRIYKPPGPILNACDVSLRLYACRRVCDPCGGDGVRCCWRNVDLGRTPARAADPRHPRSHQAHCHVTQQLYAVRSDVPRLGSWYPALLSVSRTVQGKHVRFQAQNRLQFAG